ncbi:unnamed protein product [Lasius platythorax]|uniref:Uncharacterized protein n=1 Tax=Lasius platythorax TaxID=488582 RepID=A0AAV2P343_9HYME
MKREVDRKRADRLCRKDFVEFELGTKRYDEIPASTNIDSPLVPTATSRTVRLGWAFRKSHVTGILMFRARLRCCTNCGNYRKTKYLGHITLVDLTERDADAFRESSVDEN